MKLGMPKEIMDGEARVALTPESALKLQKLGHEVFVESGAGEASSFADKAYADAGVTVLKSAKDLYSQVDVVAKVRPTTSAELKMMKKGQTLIGFFNPGGDEAGLKQAESQGVNVIAMEMVPRI